MKITKETEVTVCDVCGEPSYDDCLGCGADHCCDHKKELGIVYRHSVWFSGYGDGYYCHECDAALKESGDNPLYAAYLEMYSLIEEYKASHVDFKRRAKEVEQRIATLYDKHEGGN